MNLKNLKTLVLSTASLAALSLSFAPTVKAQGNPTAAAQGDSATTFIHDLLASGSLAFQTGEGSTSRVFVYQRSHLVFDSAKDFGDQQAFNPKVQGNNLVFCFRPNDDTYLQLGFVDLTDPNKTVISWPSNPEPSYHYEDPCFGDGGLVACKARYGRGSAGQNSLCLLKLTPDGMQFLGRLRDKGQQLSMPVFSGQQIICRRDTNAGICEIVAYNLAPLLNAHGRTIEQTGHVLCRAPNGYMPVPTNDGGIILPIPDAQGNDQLWYRGNDGAQQQLKIDSIQTDHSDAAILAQSANKIFMVYSSKATGQLQLCFAYLSRGDANSPWQTKTVALPANAYWLDKSKGKRTLGANFAPAAPSPAP